MFYIIHIPRCNNLQITNNLKILTTGIFMYIFLNRKLSCTVALIILVFVWSPVESSSKEGGLTETRGVQA